ncbi:MAG: hypothetical protein HY283_01565 [Nitrospirae bacterium]|nr:hypothetical protein [Nitrospirota bacterium]
MLRPWSLKNSKCVNCGTVDVPHRSRGLCRVCYEREANERRKLNKSSFIRKHGILKNITREYFIERYEKNGASLQDIASELKCSRQYVLKLMKSFGIERRSKQDARATALGKGKIAYEIKDTWGNIKHIQHKKQEIDRSFFNNWTDGFAYVLGLIYTDGNLIKESFVKNRNKVVARYQVSISQKDPYILDRIKEMLSLNTALVRSRNNEDSYIHTLRFYDKEIFERLESFGLCPNKSLKIAFPDIPSRYLSGFIRGVFDGDGSYSGKKATLVTGSEAFANGLNSALNLLGFPAHIYVNSTSSKHPSYSVQISSGRAGMTKLYQFLYRRASIFIPRKREQLKSFCIDPNNIRTRRLYFGKKKAATI